MTTATAKSIEDHALEDRAYHDKCLAVGRAIILSIPRPNTVVDLGCGPGYIGNVLHSHGFGPQVTYVDGRAEHLKQLAFQGKQTLVADVHEPTGLKADLVLCLGLLYHSAYPKSILENCANIAPIIAVETLCVDSPKSVCVIQEESNRRHDQSLNGWGSFHTVSWIKETLQDVGYTNVWEVSVPTIEPSEIHRGFLYDWDLQHTGMRYRIIEGKKYALRKLWIGRKDD